MPACSPQGTEAAAISVGEPEASCEAECSLEPLDTCGAGDKWDQGRSDCKWKICRLACCHFAHVASCCSLYTPWNITGPAKLDISIKVACEST